MPYFDIRHFWVWRSLGGVLVLILCTLVLMLLNASRDRNSTDPLPVTYKQHQSSPSSGNSRAATFESKMKSATLSAENLPEDAPSVPAESVHETVLSLLPDKEEWPNGGDFSMRFDYISPLTRNAGIETVLADNEIYVASVASFSIRKESRTPTDVFPNERVRFDFQIEATIPGGQIPLATLSYDYLFQPVFVGRVDPEEPWFAVKWGLSDQYHKLQRCLLVINRRATEGDVPKLVRIVPIASDEELRGASSIVATFLATRAMDAVTFSKYIEPLDVRDNHVFMEYCIRRFAHDSVGGHRELTHYLQNVNRNVLANNQALLFYVASAMLICKERGNMTTEEIAEMNLVTESLKSLAVHPQAKSQLMAVMEAP